MKDLLLIYSTPFKLNQTLWGQRPSYLFHFVFLEFLEF